MSNEKGYALILVSAFATLLGLSGNFYMMKAYQRAKSKKALTYLQVVDEQSAQIKTLLSSWNECSHNLNGQRIGQDLQIRPGLLKSVIQSTDGKEYIWPSLEFENVHGEILVDKIRVENSVSKISGNIEPHLSIYFDLNPGGIANFFTLKQIVRRFRLKVRRDTVDPQIIRNCFHEDDNFIEDKIKGRCAAIPNATYDEDNFLCNIPPPVLSGDFIQCGFDIVRIEKDVDGNFNVVCGGGVL